MVINPTKPAPIELVSATLVRLKGRGSLNRGLYRLVGP